ncbi:polymorphic toxin type 17 domain-containing protein, partial [Cellulomonas phragmiteti]
QDRRRDPHEGQPEEDFKDGPLDRFGNEWINGPARTPEDPIEWDVQLSDRGRFSIGWLSDLMLMRD